jgi:hypothetical protein
MMNDFATIYQMRKNKGNGARRAYWRDDGEREVDR